MYKFAIVGAGLIAGSHAGAIAAQPDATLAAVCDVLPERAEAFAAEWGAKPYTDIESMLKKEDIDIVTLCIPTFLHAAYVELCARHKKHILCEKPVEMTVEATERILRAVEENGVIFMVAQVVRFWPGYVQIKELCDSGALGDIYMAYFSRCSSFPHIGTWLFDPEKGAGAIQDMHVHDVDFMQSLFGPAEKVYCQGARDHTGCFDHVFSSITYKRGIKGVAEASFAMRNSYPFTMFAKISGSLASVEMLYAAGVNISDRSAPSAYFKLYRDDEDPVLYDIEQYDAYVKEVAYFISCVRAGKQPERVPHSDNLDVIKTVCAIRQSAESGEVVKL